MKRSNLLKIASLLLIVAMMFSVVPASAAVTDVKTSTSDSEVTVSGTVVTVPSAVLDPALKITTTFTVMGEYATEADALAAAIDNTKRIHGDTIFTTAGNYTYKFNMDANAASGWYVVIESTLGATVSKKAFKYSSTADMTDVVAAVQAAAQANDVTMMEAALNDYADVLGIDGIMALMSPAALTAAAQEMLKNEAFKTMPVTAASLPMVLANAQQADLLQALNTGAITTVAQLEEFIGFIDVAPSTKYADAFANSTALFNLGDATKQKVLTAISGKNFSDISAMVKETQEQTLLIFAKDTGNAANFVKVVRELGDIPAMTNYAAFMAAANKNLADVTGPMGLARNANTISTFNTGLEIKPVIVTPSNPGSTGSSNTGGGIVVPVSNKEVKYTDIGMIGWASDAIVKLTDLGVFDGYLEDNGTYTFRPNNSITREEFVKALLVCTSGTGAASTGINPTFTDAQGGWYSPFLDVAEKKGLTEGKGDGTFGIGELITRQDLSTMVYRMLVSEHYNVNTNAVNFTDGGSISDYAVPCVNALANAGVVTGYEDGSFGPFNNATRAEAAVMLFRACQAIRRF